MNKEDLLKIEREINNLKNLKNSYVSDKISKQLESSEIKEAIGGRSIERMDLVKKRNEVKKYITDLELKIKQVNIEIKDKRRLMNEVGQCLNEEKEIPNGVISEIIVLKNKYSKFASDLTRVSSMRVMANTFSVELESVINKL